MGSEADLLSTHKNKTFKVEINFPLLPSRILSEVLKKTIEGKGKGSRSLVKIILIIEDKDEDGKGNN
jgi:hypothetical protein